MKKTLLMLLILFAAVFSSSGAYGWELWDLSEDFNAVPDGNPDPPWEYREVWDANDHPNYNNIILTYHDACFTETYSPGRPGYSKELITERTSTGVMLVEGSDWNPGWGAAYVGELAAGHALVRWTSPVEQTVLISGYARQLGFNDTRHHTWSIRKNNTVLTSGSLDAVGNHNFDSGSGGAAALTVDVVPGDKIDFLVRVNTGPATAAMWYAFKEAIATAPDPNTPRFLTLQTNPGVVTSVTPAVGQHQYYDGLWVDVSANDFVDCPLMYSFDHWDGDVLNPSMASTKIFMDADKTITAVFVDARQCGDECHPVPAYDLDGNCRVNLDDLALLAGQWLDCTHPDCD